MMRKIRNLRGKKGISHVEVILSFIIFVGFLIFVLAVLNPFKSFGDGEAYLDVLERAVRGYSNMEVNFVTLRINETAVIEKCFQFKYNSSLQNISVRNESYDFVEVLSEEVRMQALSEKGKIEELGEEAEKEIERMGEEKERKIYINSTGKFFYIYFCDDFNVSNRGLKDMDCVDLSRENYTLGLFREYNMTSYVKLEKLEEEYYADYEETKKALGLPKSKDFSFNVRDTTGENILSVARKMPKGNILAKDTPIQLVYVNGTLQYALLNIRVW